MRAIGDFCYWQRVFVLRANDGGVQATCT